jgi:hypothetical protein
VSREQRDAGVRADWTLLRFEAPDADAARLAGVLAETLDAFGCHADFHTAHESFVVFAGRVFRYATGDHARRDGPDAYARTRGVPDAQIDWP